MLLAGFFFTLWRYFQERSPAKPPAAASSPIGDVRVFGAALNDSSALNRIAEKVECVCENQQAFNKQFERLSDDIREIRKNLDRREDRGGRQE